MFAGLASIYFIHTSLDTLNLKLKMSVLTVLVIEIRNYTCLIKMFLKNKEPSWFKWVLNENHKNRKNNTRKLILYLFITSR